MQGFITRCDQLALLGKPVDCEDQLEFILNGLPEEYKTISDHLEGRDVTPSISEVHEKLLNREAKLLTLSTNTSALPITANTASHNPQARQQKNTQSLPQTWNKNHNNSRYNNRDNKQSRGGYQGGYQGSYQGASQGGYQGRCQLCGGAGTQC